MIKYKILKDARGFPVLASAPPHEAVGHLLTTSFKFMEHFDEAKKEIEKVINSPDRNAKWDSGFDAHDLVVSKNSAKIIPYYEQSPPCEITLQEFQEILKVWKKAILGE